MAYFDADFIQFFKELEANNNRDWFQANKKRYEARVKKPFASFVAELIDQLQPLDPRMLITPKDAIFRIYRDVRFSPDKAPYKNHVSANLSPGGRKDMLRPGIYLQFNHQSAAVYSGLYRLQAKEVQKVREHIAANLETFDELVSDADFVETFGRVQGEKNKRIPKEFRDLEAQQPLIANKSFFYSIEWEPQSLLAEDLVERVLESYRVARPLAQFLETGVLAE
ncbi:MAG: DUF2461 domain-containing protein [Bacteroidota bacterium]